jgi:RNA polymerase sigma factor (TIGR02999 family)
LSETATISELIEGVRSGRAEASDRLFVLLYDEFKSRARVLLRAGPRQTICTTELVSETWLRLSGKALPVESRLHFFNLAARAMRQVLIDRARSRQADKRGLAREPLTLGAAAGVSAETPFDVLALDRVMGELAQVDAQLAQLAELHLFGGVEIAEIARMRGVSERTVFRDWRTARMFLVKFIDGLA